jgi:hypothetical protein
MNLTPEQQQIALDALQTIATSYTVERLHRISEKQYGLEGPEAVEAAYENVQAVAKDALGRIRRRKVKVRAA